MWESISHSYVQAAWDNFMFQHLKNENVKRRHNVAQWLEAAWVKVTLSITNTWASIGYKSGLL
jgi:hypothetical protein